MEIGLLSLGYLLSAIFGGLLVAVLISRISNINININSEISIVKYRMVIRRYQSSQVAGTLLLVVRDCSWKEVYL